MCTTKLEMEPSKKNKTLRVASLNCEGFRRSEDYIRDYLNESQCDILFLQETWLLNSNLDMLVRCHNQYLTHGKSGVDQNAEILYGRPSGGVAIVYKKTFGKLVKPINCNNRRVCCAMLSLDGETRIFICCLYLPCDNYSNTEVSHEYESCLHDVECIMNAHEFDECFIFGDLNTCFTRNNAQSAFLNEFMIRNGLCLCWDSPKAMVSDTYVNYALGHRSCIDHALLSPHLFDFVAECAVHYDPLNPSNHNVVEVNVVLPGMLSATPSQHAHCRAARPPTCNWEKATPEDLEEYRMWLDELLSPMMDDITLLQCHDIECQREEHKRLIDITCEIIVECCLQASSLSIPMKRHNVRKIPGWNEFAQRERETSLMWHRIWTDCGKPYQGMTYEIMKKTRRTYHAAVRDLKRRKFQVQRHILATKVNNGDDIWLELKKINPKGQVIAPSMDGAEDDEAIADVFFTKFSQLYCSVPTAEEDMASLCHQIKTRLLTESRNTNTACNTEILKKCLGRMKKRKHDPSSGLDSEHLLRGSHSLFLSLANLFNAAIIHGHFPNPLLQSTIIAIPKNLNSSLCSSENYRGIALCSAICKLFDLMIIEQYKDHFITTDLQFGFKAHQSTTMCSTVLTEAVSYFTERKSNVYACLLDATKAFDKVHFGKMFQLLLRRRLPATIVRVLLDAYSRQEARVSWGTTTSAPFFAQNGVKQGGVISPVLFTVYYDELLQQLRNRGVGCHVGPHYVGAIAYADDITLLAPTLRSLNEMITTALQFADDYDMMFNAKKTVCIKFGSPHTDDEKIFINNQEIEWQDSCVHLGHKINTKLDDACDCRHKASTFIGSVNKLMGNFGHLSRKVLSRLFQTYCGAFYGSQLWRLDSPHVKHVCTQWNKAARRILDLPRQTHRWLLPHLLKQEPLLTQFERRTLRHIMSMQDGPNGIAAFFARVALESRKSTLGLNVGYLMYARAVNFQQNSEMNNQRIKDAAAADDCHLPFISAACELMSVIEDGVESVPGFTTLDLSEMLRGICVIEYVDSSV